MKLEKRIRLKIYRFIGKIWLFALLKMNQVSKKDWIFFIPYGVGDTIFLSSLIGEFKLKNGGKVTIIVKESHEILVKMFPDVDRCISIKHNFPNFYYEKVCDKFPIRRGKIYIPHPVLNSSLSSLIRILGYKNLSLIDMYKISLQLNEEAKIKAPNMDVYNLAAAKSFLNNIGFIPSKTLLLLPDANSILCLPNDFWNLLIAKLQNLGFSVIVNSSNKNNSFTNQKNVVVINGELSETVAIGLTCFLVISLRNGICDLLGFSEKRLIVLYPDLESYKAYTLKNIFTQKIFPEIVVDQISEKETMANKIINLVQSDK